MRNAAMLGGIFIPRTCGTRGFSDREATCGRHCYVLSILELQLSVSVELIAAVRHSRGAVESVRLRRTILPWLLFGALFLHALGCGGLGPDQIFLMPPPDVYDDGVIDPFADAISIEDLPYDGILYATDRSPATEEASEPFYANAPGGLLRLGVARVDLVGNEVSWDDIRDISLLKQKSARYPLKVAAIREYGVLDRSATQFSSPDSIGADPHLPAERFASSVNSKLATSNRKDVYIYVHGYKVVFENPILVAMELWHFLGYDGVFIAYSWPSTPSRFAYLKDTETAEGNARDLRLLIEYLAEETNVERINIIGYSAGTRLVARTLEQLALKHERDLRAEIQATLRIGKVLLIGSDIDREVFANYLADGLLEVPGHVSIYVAEQDRALRFAERLTRRQRVGQAWSRTAMAPQLVEYLIEPEAGLSIINVSAAPGASSGNGHRYFRQSPWASSDVLITLSTDLAPGDRGLVREGDSPVWTFPNDYIERLRAALLR
ncbi:MAG: alpha/beta hydrolase [Deltaproteobacteria bacterium]|nr:alpha/beta hydrolase [Deltaproteobacteria bacterium]